MRFSTFLAASVATVALCASAPALAAPFSVQDLGAGASVDLSSAAGILSQSTDDSSLFGVRARTVGSRPQGNGSFEILRPSVGSPSPTPTGACTVGANGWCDTPHHIAATAFGWNFSATGAGVIIGIVDSGIDLNHPDFAGRILTGTCIVSSLNPCTSANDQVGGDLAVFPGPNATHGTHVAGIAAGSVTGLATSADILPVKVCSSTSSSCSGVDDGILWASQHGANVINISIGGPILSPSDITIFQQAVANGSLLVVAAGNAGTKNPTSGFLAGAALKDGVRGSMIVVGATGAGGSGGHGQVSSFSQVPSTQCEVHAGVRYCMKDFFVVAPGANIWSTVGNGADPSATYGYLSGTSMATPYVTGVAAVIKGMWPSLTSSQIASIIFQTTDDLGAPGVDPVYGRGAVDITKALSPVGPSVVANSSFSIAPGGSSSQNSAIAAVGGGQATAQTLAPFGVAGATTALAAGPLAVAVRNSTILKSAVVVDSFGRTFHADLTRASFNAPIVDIDNYMASGMFQSVRGFGGAAETPIGYVVASGFTVTTQTQRQYMGDALMGDHARTGLYDFSASLGLTDGMSLDVGYNTRMAGRFNAYDATTSEAYDGLFFSASGVNSPYVSLTDGGNYVGTTMAMGGDVHVQFGASWVAPQEQEFQVPLYAKADQLIGRPTQYDQRHAQSSMASVTWDFASWGGLGMTVSQTDEQNGFLGGFTAGALAVNRSASTTAVGFSGRVGFGDGWVGTLSYSEGLTRLSLFDNSLVDGADPLKSRSYGVAIAKRGLFGDNDSIGLALTRPIQVYSGGVDLAVATDADGNGNLIVSHEHVSLASATPETDLEAGYGTALFGGVMSLQANAAYQMNVNGQAGVNAVTFLSRASITF
jgi:subtilisin family serine protease